jgi:hypothetical protein
MISKLRFKFYKLEKQNVSKQKKLTFNSICYILKFNIK